ncbi:MAG: hypothetical protein KDB52_00755 [Solirubrobacterales bacterium]|nr:hypothetical protein [Solirubrobacterales bacterium]
MKARIHRGASEVGGSTVELEAGGQRLVLDVGLPLSPSKVRYRDLLPDVPGLWAEGDGSLLGVLVSHGHLDHCGLADLVRPEIPVFMSEAGRRVLEQAAFYNTRWQPPKQTRSLPLDCSFDLGPFRITTFRVDHSAYDSRAFLIEAAGKRLVYSGDLRAHGRKSGWLENLIKVASGSDCLLLEGTNVGREVALERNSSMQDELAVEERCSELFAHHEGLALAFFSAQNTDRLVSVRNAARRAGRHLILDLYANDLAKATNDPTVPSAMDDGVRVYVTESQRRRVLRSGEFDRVNYLGRSRIFRDEIAEDPGRWVMLTRNSMLGELARDQCLVGARSVWMSWPGYLEPEFGSSGQELAQQGLSPEFVHTSGHARVFDLQCLATALAPDRVIPIHTNEPNAYADLFEGVEVKDDNEWWEV